MQPTPQILPTTTFRGKSLSRNDPIPPKGSGATPSRCARAHPPDKVKKLQVKQNSPSKKNILKGCLHPFKGSGATVGYHKKGYPNQNNKNRKRQSKPSAITWARAPARLTPRPRAQNTARPTPLASGASSVSLDPSRARATTPPRPTPLGLGREFRLARPLLGSGANAASLDPPSQSKASDTRRPYPRHDRRSYSHIAAGHGGDYSNHPGHCSLTSFTM